MNRLTTDTPEGNFQALMNFAYAKNGEVWLRGAGDDGEDVLLNEYISQLSKCNLVGCEIETEDVPESCAQGCFCHLGALFAAATQAAELRARLSAYEEVGLSPEEIDDFARQTSKIRMAAGCSTLDDSYNLAKSGRLVVLPCTVGDVVYPIYADQRHEARIVGVSFDQSGKFWATWGQYDNNPDDPQELWDEDFFSEEEIGKSVFLTREEADAALATTDLGGTDQNTLLPTT